LVEKIATSMFPSLRKTVSCRLPRTESPTTSDPVRVAEAMTIPMQINNPVAR
jgi:hypothetical protein